MEAKSIFLRDIEKYYNLVVKSLNEADRNNAKGYLHKELFLNRFSPDMNWNSGDFSNAIIAADVVSMDSSAPLKSRGALRVASGRVTKVSIAYKKNEYEMTQLLNLQARGGQLAELAGLALNDLKAVVDGIDVRNEILALQGLSEGVILTPEEGDEGVGIRVDFGYKDENKLKAKAVWGGASADPVGDLERLFEKAEGDGVKIQMLLMDNQSFKELRASERGKLMVAIAQGGVVTDAKSLAVGSRQAMIDAIQDEFGCRLVIVDGSYKVQDKAGKERVVRPWKRGAIVGVPEEKVGGLFYSTLAEEQRPAPHVAYSKVGSYTLTSVLSETNPFSEITIGQALVLPVVDNGGRIYTLDSTVKG